MIKPALRTVAASYPKERPTVEIWTNVNLPPAFTGRRHYDGVPYDYADQVLANWPGGNMPGWNLQFQVGAFMEASSGGHWIALTIGGVYVLQQNMSEPGGGANVLTNWTTVAQNLTGQLVLLDGADFNDFSHFREVDVRYRYIRS